MNQDRGLLQAGEFAARAGVTVRALHHYDRLGLLTPRHRSESGYRLYDEHDFVRLQQIVALRFLGFPLKEIRAIVDARELSLEEALALQLSVLRERRDHIDGAIRAVTTAQRAFAQSGASAWQMIREVITIMEEQRQWSWAKEHFTPEQLEALAERGENGVRERGERDWKDLIAEVEASVHDDPAGERGQALAKRWRELISQFTGGDPGITGSLKSVWKDERAVRPWSDEADAWIKKAMSCGKPPSP